MEPRTYLRLEGVTVFVSALAAFFVLDGPLWLLVVLALAPDLAMVGYGLKYSSGFKDTHLSIQPAPVSAFVDHE
ncbi:DUF4260 family protein [Halapricum desulfuricans]|uniref:Uncharacterized protein n=1 Tax=Halapricum desulfuricans TaxID=2841257 RepID=A0A897NLV7_9EURY|nr:DUF4260 family protein [Halapricum desulfuricans]QSG13678.1 hypothetical protein HSEST_0121 [Halapricum desulfuricans]